MTRGARIYQTRRAALVVALGGKCVQCGSDHDLEFDHHSGRDWELRAVSSHMRMARYEREAAEGLLRLLCSGCNGSDGGKRGIRRRWRDREEDEERLLDHEAEVADAPPPEDA